MNIETKVSLIKSTNGYKCPFFLLELGSFVSGPILAKQSCAAILCH